MSTSPIPARSLYEDYARCIHCGLCLNACPTYRLWNLEADSRAAASTNDSRRAGNFRSLIRSWITLTNVSTAAPANRLPLRRRVWKARRARARAHRADCERSWISRVARDYVLPAVAAQSASHRRSRPRLRLYTLRLQAVARAIGC